MIKATLHYWKHSFHHQTSIEAETESELLTEAFMFQVKKFADGTHIEIDYLEYSGCRLKWNEYAAHNHFAEGRISFWQFKTMCATANMSMAQCN